MSVYNPLHTPKTARLLSLSVLMAAMGMAISPQAAEAASPYVQLYKNNVNTQSDVNSSANQAAAPAARVTSSRRHVTPTAKSPSSTQPSAPVASSQEATPTVRVTYPIRYQAGEPVNGIDLLSTQLPQIPTPTVSVTDISYIPTVVVPKTKNSNAESLDVSLVDDFINEINPHARHYPPNFDNVSQRYYSRIKLKELESWLRPYAEAPNASYDVLLRAAKLNGLGRNLDLGSDFTVRASTYVAKAIGLQPNSAEANFLYGMMLSEGGGFKEGQKYLEKAAGFGYTEAEQSLAQSDLLSDRRPQALSRLRRLINQYPNNQQLKKQIQIVENGEYYIWDLPVKAN